MKQKLERKNVFLVGGGYVSIATAYKLQEAGFSPIILSKSDLKQPIANVPFYKGDIANEELVKEIFAKHKPASVIITAAVKELKQVGGNVEELMDTNVRKTLALAQLVAKFGAKIILTSSALAYKLKIDMHENDAIVEEDELASSEHPSYASSKILAEAGMKSLAEITNVGFARVSNVAGGYEGCPPHSGVLAAWTALALKDEPISISGKYSGGHFISSVRDFIHPNDVASGLIAMLNDLLWEEKPGLKIWNISSGKGTSLWELFTALEQRVGRPLKWVHQPASVVDKVVLSSRKAQTVTNWRLSSSTIDQIVQSEFDYQKALQEKLQKEKEKTKHSHLLLKGFGFFAIAAAVSSVIVKSFAPTPK